MRYFALACDFDGTLASGGVVDETVVAALKRLRTSGRKLILVTGRHLPDLLDTFAHIELFDRVVAENGALLYRPATREEKMLAEKPPEALIRALRDRGVEPLSMGRAIIATRHPQETAVLETIHRLGLEYQVIFNKGAVMILPSGINKATGFKAALNEVGLSPHNAVGVGDGENDHAFLSICEFSVAVANALPVIRERADFVTAANDGLGVMELIEKMIRSDLREYEPRLVRDRILLGKREEGEISLDPYGAKVLLAGTSGGGKSTLATGFLEQLMERKYQVCIIDPEGDYSTLEAPVVVGGSQTAPSIPEALKVLERPDRNLVINLLGINREGRPSFFRELLPRLQELRSRTGRPHWVVIDEAHHLLPANWDPMGLIFPQESYGIMLITVHPEHVSPSILGLVNTVVALGQSPENAIRSFEETLGRVPPALPPQTLGAGEAIYWSDSTGAVKFRSLPPQAERLRHRRKYARGELAPDRSFYFRGPKGRLNLRAQNLSMFMQIAEGVDDETWLYHLRLGEYSHWFRNYIKDDELAEDAQEIEWRVGISAADSRRLIREAIETRYTAPS